MNHWTMKEAFVIGKLYEFTGTTAEFTSNAQKGSVWRYIYDDGSYAPKFEYVSGQQNGHYRVGDKTFLHVSQFKVYEELAEADSDYTIRVDSYGTNISVKRRLTIDQLHKVISIIEGVE